MNLKTLKQKARTWWADSENRKGLFVIAVLALSFPAFFSFGSRKPTPPNPTDLDALARRVGVLEAAASKPPVEQPSPDPAPARPSARRAAVRPTQPAAPTAPAEAPNRWGTTDLDRAIAATPSVNLLEQAK